MPAGHGYVGKTTNTERDISGAHLQAEREDMWGEMPGKIVSFDKDKQTATVQPLYKKRLNGEPTALPELQEVPVRFPRVGGFIMTMPVRAGDRVTLRPQMRNNEAYHEEDQEYAANDARSFSLSDYEAFLDGGESLATPIENFNADRLEIRSEGSPVKVDMADDVVRLVNDQVRVVARNQYVQLKAGEMHLTIDLVAGQIVSSHPIVLGPDPHPED
ncbi:hypothetical protein L0F51_00290 [Afifella sp. H1R]|uniref:Gp138 family membrane-puncturing spike protein n=1 Tax=Afifella sp. H1R TaxID=2908841 RepID=UPI001F1A55D9|nr:Gp138 family membrane-puncturing spike protein [Afifella sp. H1R]MCF1502203.1 hypothetical protein [Afifella sp. H1R]